jgi:RNA polymerase sigma factor (sigma-70 family)
MSTTPFIHSAVSAHEKRMRVLGRDVIVRQPYGIVQQQIERLLERGSLAGLSEWQLVESYATERDERAFEALVARHGPMVFGVCRRVLHNDQAAEDAFQATFLVLIRKAPSLDRDKPLGSWLYTVAYRLALRIRANEARRLGREAQAVRRRPNSERYDTTPGDHAVVLDEELQRLPARHRVPLVLCYLEGKTNEQAAEVLGCPRGSMSARLAQAREHLRTCLARRGYAVPATGIATLLASAGAEAGVPVRLLSDTVRTAQWFTSKEAGIAGVISTRAIALAKGTFRALFVFKLKVAGAALVTAAMLGSGATMLLKAASQTSPPAQAVEHLPEARPDHADIAGQRLPSGVLARMGSTQLRHGDVVSFAAYMPDGRELMTAGRDKTVRLWDLATGKEIRRFDWGEPQPDSEPGPSPDGTMQQHEHQMAEDRALNGLAALTSDGRIVAASRDGVVCWWETASGKKLHQLQTGQRGLLQLAFSADARSLLALGSSGETVVVWDVATGKCVRRSEGKAGGGAVLTDQNARVSPGWKYLAYLTRKDGGNRLINIRDLATGKELAQIDAGNFGATQTLCFSADDKTLVWDHFPARGIVVSDAATGKELRRLGYHRRPDGDGPFDDALAIALSADGESLAVCRMSHTIELWDLASGKCTYPLGKPTEAQLELRCTDNASAYAKPALTFSADGKKLICSLGGETARQFETDTGTEVPGTDTGHRWPVSTLALSADGKSLYTYAHGDPVRVWDLATGKETSQRTAPDRAIHAVFSSEGRIGFATDRDFILCGAGSENRWKIKESPVSVALSPDGSLVAMRFWPNPEVLLRDATTGQERYTLGQASDRPDMDNIVLTEVTGVVPAHLVFSPDGRWLAGAGQARQFCLWDVATGTLLWQLPTESGPAIERFAFSANSLCLATVNADHTVTLYEALTGAQRCRLGATDPNKRSVYLSYGGTRDFMQMRRDLPVCLAFSPDGHYLATAKDTPEIHLWDILAGRELGLLEGHEGSVVSLLFSADGKRLFSGGSDTTALSWDLTRLTDARRGSPDRAARLQPQELDALWTDLAGDDATRAFDAIRKLSASPDQAVALIQERVCPAPSPDPKRMAQLLADLENGRVELRRQAESVLERLGDLAEPALYKALDGELPLVLRRRMERLLDKLYVPTPVQMRDLRAVELLELVGRSDARQLLKSLADGVPGTRLTREAKSAMQRLTNQAGAP